MNKQTIVPVLIGMALSTVAVGGVSYYHSKASASEPSILNTTTGQTNSDAEAVSVTQGPIDLITVTPPFENWSLHQQLEPVRFQGPADESFANITVVTPFTFGDNQLPLPISFVDHGPDMTDLSSNQPTTLIEKITFEKEGSIVWQTDDGTGSPNYTWAEHPDHMIVPAGGTVIVSYTNKGKDSHWTGSVVVQ